MSEKQVQALIMRALTEDPLCRVFRNNVCLAYCGTVVGRTPDTVTLRNYRQMHAGLCVGSADLIGWYRGRFLSVECKSEIGSPSREQIIWRDNVIRAGGIAGIVRSMEEAKELISS